MQNWPNWSPDGKEVIFMNQVGGGSADILALLIQGDGEVREVVVTDYNENMPALSRSGKWLAYVSNVTGREEIWVRSYPNPGPPIRISANGGTEPVWGVEDGEILFYQGDNMMAATVKTEMEFRVEGVEMLFTANGSYDIGLDGRFLLNKPIIGNQSMNEIHVVLNWFEELKRLAPTDN